MAILVSTVRWDMALNYAARLGVGILGLVSAVLAVGYTWIHGDEMVDVLVKTSADEKLLERLVALTTPVVILTLIAALAVTVIWALHARGLEETGRAVDSMNRIRRESEVAVSARGLIHAFEEKLANASRGFSVLLWLGRTLFIVCLGLFATAVITATADGVNVFTVAMGATSIVGVLLAVLTGLPEKTQHQLADVVQIAHGRPQADGRGRGARRRHDRQVRRPALEGRARIARRHGGRARRARSDVRREGRDGERVAPDPRQARVCQVATKVAGNPGAAPP